jgi:prophage regulatory protein
MICPNESSRPTALEPHKARRSSMSIPTPVPNALLQILRLPHVCKATGLCRSTIYQLEADRQFPHRIRLGARSVGWVESEVQEWLANRIKHSRCTS